MYKGSDYRIRSNTALPIPVSDPGGVLHAILIDSDQVASIIFGAGVVGGSSANQVTGTVGTDDGIDLIYANNQLMIKVEVTSAQSADATASEDYEYHIKAIAPVVGVEPAGDEVVKISGCLDLRHERTTP